MASLTDIFGTVKQIAFKDDKGVYLGDVKIALDNTRSNAYIRRNGERSLTRLNTETYESTEPLLFIGAVPKADPLKLEIATIAALNTCDNLILSSTIDKQAIAESEDVDIKKFDNVALVKVEYTASTKKIYDPKCDYDLC